MGLIRVLDRATGLISLQESNDSQVCHSVNAQGDYIGLAPLGANLQVPDPPPVGTGWRWNNTQRRWVRIPPLPEAIEFAINEIDVYAVKARARYVTLIPGQELIYDKKARQAQNYITAYASDVNTAVPAYIQAEATATDTTAISAANSIVAEANLVDLVMIDIERERRRGKYLVSLASNLIEVRNRKNNAVAALNSI